LGGNVHAVKENAETLVVASKETGLEVNTDKTKYVSCEQSARQDHNLNIATKSFENVADSYIWE